MSGAALIVIDTRPGEVRAAALDAENKPFAFHVERDHERSHVGALYLGRVLAVRQNLGAAFVDLGLGTDGFLNIKSSSVDARGVRIVEGAAILVQITRDAEAAKGPTLGAAIDIAGSALVLTPGKSGLGLSSRISDNDQRAQLKALFKDTDFKDAGLVVRTAAADMPADDVLLELKTLQARWQDLVNGLAGLSAPALIEAAPGLAGRMVRDYAGTATREILLDDAGVAAQLKSGLSDQPAAGAFKITSTPVRTSAFDAAGISDAFEAAFSPLAHLPGGGTLVITETPAMTTIDVNAGRGAAGNEERLAFETNAEAAAVLTRELRLRGIGGLIAVDFLKMRDSANQDKILAELKNAFRSDPAGPRVGAFSPFGIVDIVRRSSGPSLAEIFLTTRKTRTPETVALEALSALSRQAGASATLTVSGPVAAVLTGPLAGVRKTLEQALGFVIRLETVESVNIEAYEIKE